ncbi:MAG TPA: HIRAN domain-containing protein [Microvirga sp.]|nr:HIRAN domain-containing protein [Microvirga sp.]
MTNWIERISEPQRLILAWQAPDHMGLRFRWAVAVLERREGTHVLRYLRPGAEFSHYNHGRTFQEITELGYQGYPAFSLTRDLHTEAVVETLVRRLPPRNRADFQEYKRQFRLAANTDPSDFALLGYTEAKLPSDGFSIVNPLDPESDACDLLLEVAGFRYYAPPLLPNIAVGQAIELLPEPENEHDPNAVKICIGSQKIGNINRLQAPTLLRWLAEREVTACIERLNGKPNHPRGFIFVRVGPAATRIAA